MTKSISYHFQISTDFHGLVGNQSKIAVPADTFFIVTLQQVAKGAHDLTAASVAHVHPIDAETLLNPQRAFIFSLLPIFLFRFSVNGFGPVVC